VIPGMDGLRAIAEFGRIRPELPVIILSSSENPADVRAALANGALGYVPKSAAEHTLLSAIRVVLNGDIYVPPFVPHQEINASADETLECVMVRSDTEAVVVNLAIEPVEKPRAVHWVDPIHKHP